MQSNSFGDEIKLKKHRYDVLGKANKFNYNPFFESYKIKLDKQYIKHVRDKDIEYIKDPVTGEIGRAYVDIYTYTVVDSERFVKIFINYLDDILNLSATGEKMFKYLLTILGRDTDKFWLDMVDCLRFTKWKSRKSVYIALLELVNEGVIARTEHEGEYYINPALFINGDRFSVWQQYQRDLGNAVPKSKRTEEKRITPYE